MFKRDLCTRCGDCLVECQWMDVQRDQAVEWMDQMIAGKRVPVLDRCITCYACNEICPEKANPFDLIAHFDDLAGYLMPHNKTGTAEDALFVGMQVGAADTTGLYLDQGIARFYPGILDILYPEVSGAIIYRCFHNNLSTL